MSAASASGGRAALARRGRGIVLLVFVQILLGALVAGLEGRA